MQEETCKFQVLSVSYGPESTMRIRKRWVFGTSFLLVVAGSLVAARAYGVDPRTWTPQTVQAWIQSFGWWAPAVYVGVSGFVRPVVTLLLPASLTTLAAGLAFGRFWGFVWALVGGVVCAQLEFVIARYLGRQAVERMLRGRVARIDASVGRHGFMTVFLLRVIPNVPFDIINYSLGLSPVRWRDYAVATTLGMAPWTIVYVWVGATLTSLRQLWQFAGVILAIVAIVALQQWLTRRRSAAATAGASPDPWPAPSFSSPKFPAQDR